MQLKIGNEVLKKQIWNKADCFNKLNINFLSHLYIILSILFKINYLILINMDWQKTKELFGAYQHLYFSESVMV